MARGWRFLAAGVGLAMTAGALVAARTGAPAQTKDAFPNGCVDCHVAGKDADMRLSVLVAQWAKAVPPALVEKAKAASADPAKIKGKHPAIPTVKTKIPQSCAGVCHKKGSTIAPPFAQLMHMIHLVGPPNRFLTANQGECTHCHKLDQKTGAWKMPTGNEK